jgi:hypothetical protein
VTVIFERLELARNALAGKDWQEAYDALAELEGISEPLEVVTIDWR